MRALNHEQLTPEGPRSEAPATRFLTDMHSNVRFQDAVRSLNRDFLANGSEFFEAGCSKYRDEYFTSIPFAVTEPISPYLGPRSPDVERIVRFYRLENGVTLRAQVAIDRLLSEVSRKTVIGIDVPAIDDTISVRKRKNLLTDYAETVIDQLDTIATETQRDDRSNGGDRWFLMGEGITAAAALAVGSVAVAEWGSNNKQGHEIAGVSVLAPVNVGGEFEGRLHKQVTADILSHVTKPKNINGQLFGPASMYDALVDAVGTLYRQQEVKSDGTSKIRNMFSQQSIAGRSALDMLYGNISSHFVDAAKSAPVNKMIDTLLEGGIPVSAGYFRSDIVSIPFNATREMTKAQVQNPELFNITLYRDGNSGHASIFDPYAQAAAVMALPTS